ncbi:M15 family metallopeptidase [Amycolatopsis sp. ATCC 39116]|uniref:M15 family metallopeptidase n=1 Tax=Amycolatopsis TaxID=1813 RepID=UPI0002628894|nr:M15 family metallopeptidase [Amycolatopsis sp. ATCC 39116]
MNHTLPLPAPARRVRRIVLAGLAIAGVVIAAPGVRRLFVAAAPPVPWTTLGEADGVVPDGAPVSVWDETPAVGKLDADLLDALRRAAKAAEADGVQLRVNSGWRSPEYQEELLRRAVARHGSRQEAARWVATPETSPHVAGEAVDIGPARAAAWLSAHGAAYGLCQIYRNEPWHYELRPDAVRHGCPPMYPDPSEDPRMRP